MFLNSCIDCSPYGDGEFRQKHNYFVVEKKYMREGKFHTITGFGIDHKPDTFSEVGHLNVFNSAQIGDTLLKATGKTEVVLIRGDSQLLFPFICDGKEIK